MISASDFTFLRVMTRGCVFLSTVPAISSHGGWVVYRHRCANACVRVPTAAHYLLRALERPWSGSDTSVEARCASGAPVSRGDRQRRAPPFRMPGGVARCAIGSAPSPHAGVSPAVAPRRRRPSVACVVHSQGRVGGGLWGASPNARPTAGPSWSHIGPDSTRARPTADPASIH